MKHKVSVMALWAVFLAVGATAVAAEVDYARVYAPILDGFYALMSDSSGEAEIEGETGVREAASQSEEYGVLERVGYAVKDISGDGIPELLIGATGAERNPSPPGNAIYAVYTCVDGAPRFAFEGYARSSYRWLGKGKFFYEGAGGASASMFGTYLLSRDGMLLACTECYFTSLKDGGAGKTGFYRNVSGSWDTAASQELKISAKQFEQMRTKWARQTRIVALTPFAEYRPVVVPPSEANAPGLQLRVQMGREALAGLSAWDEFVASSEEPRCDLLFSADRPVKDFKVLALEANMDENGKLKYNVRELYALDQLTPELPLLVVTAFFGDLPNNGFSYVDASGATRRFSVELSGEDGSLLMKEF